MSAPTFNSTRAVRFDLAEGAVRSGSGGERIVLAETTALGSLLDAAPPAAAEAYARASGGSVGRRAAARMGTAASLSVEAFLVQLAGEVALAGLGVLSLERWGRAMVVLLEGTPLPSALVAPFVAAAVEASAGRAVWCTLLLDEGGVARVLVSSEKAVARAKDWLAAGVAWADVLGRLQGASA
jgi:hypothetical protein